MFVSYKNYLVYFDSYDGILTFSTSFFSVISAVKIFHLQANPWKKYVLALFYIKKKNY